MLPLVVPGVGDSRHLCHLLMSRMTPDCRESSVYRGGAQLNSPYQFDTPAGTVCLRGPDVSRKQNPTSCKLYEMSLSISCSPLGANLLPSVCSVCRLPHQQPGGKKKVILPTPSCHCLCIIQMQSLSSAASSLYLLFIVQKSTEISRVLSDTVWSE